MLKVAIIGAGNIAQKVHIPAYQMIDPKCVVAIADLDQNTLDEVAKTFDIPQTYLSYKEMLKVIKPDIVSICTPNFFHLEQTLDALEAGAHVFCEKPPAMNYAQAKLMHDAAVKSGKQLGFNLHHRFRNDANWMKNKIKSNKDLIYFSDILALRRRGIPGWGVFTNQKLQGGGALIDIGIHMLDLVLYILDFPKPIYAIATKSDLIGKKGGVGDFGKWESGDQFSVEDSLFGTVTFDNGMIMNIKTAFTYHMTEKSIMNIILHSENCAYELDPCQIVTHEKKELIEVEKNQTLYAGVLEFANHILDGNKTNRTHSLSALYTQLIVEMIYLAAQTRKPVSSESFL